MTTAPVIEGSSIVLIGTFDASVAQPKKLYELGLLHDRDLTNLNIDLALPDTLAFTTEWVSLGVETNRLTAATTLDRPLAEPVRDLVLSVVEQMPGARIEMLGINKDYHFRCNNLEDYHRIGHILAPKEVLWTKFSSNPGMSSISVRLPREKTQAPGFTQVRVEASMRMANGIYVGVNDHYTAKEGSPKGLLDVLEKGWLDSQSRANSIVEAVKNLPQTET